MMTDTEHIDTLMKLTVPVLRDGERRSVIRLADVPADLLEAFRRMLNHIYDAPLNCSFFYYDIVVSGILAAMRGASATLISRLVEIRLVDQNCTLNGY